MASLTDWDAIYFRLNASDLHDRRWEAQNFGKQRVEDVVAALGWLEKHDTMKYNVYSIATAKLGTVVVGALGGKKAKISVEDFLPFSTKTADKETSITAESVAVLQSLLKTRVIDGRVVGLLADELKAASLREQSSE